MFYLCGCEAIITFYPHYVTRHGLCSNCVVNEAFKRSCKKLFKAIYHFVGIPLLFINFWCSTTKSYKTRKAKIISYTFLIFFITYILFSPITPIIKAWNDIINKHYFSILDDLIGLLFVIWIFVQFTKEVIKKGELIATPKT